MKNPQFSAIIPAYNEAKTIGYVLGEVLKTPDLGELIVVDDGSKDETQTIVKDFASDKRFIYIRHEKNKGKGAALRTGLKKAKNEIILFLDADLKNITARKITKIVEPVLCDEVDLSRARFARKKGRVTEIAAKPMMRILFPDQDFDQPITGQICGKKSFFQTVDLDTKWGVDIGILLDAIEAGQRIQEVDIGKLEHRHHTDSELSIMAEQVLETMIKKAGLIQHKYKLVIFTLDNTLIPRDAIPTILAQLGLAEETEKIRMQLERNEITYPEYLLQAAALFKGKRLSTIQQACEEVELEPYTLEVLRALRRRKFKVCLVSPSLSPIVQAMAQRLGIDMYECIELKKKSNDILTGEMSEKSKQLWMNKDIDSAMIDAMRRIIRKTKVQSTEVVTVASTPRALPILEKVGLSIAYRTMSREVRLVADKTITVLAEILALVE